MFPIEDMGVRGDLLREVREQQGIGQRELARSIGASPAFVCEVELGRKKEVSSRILAAWIRRLNVTHAFARGLHKQYSDDPVAARALASDIGEAIRLDYQEREWTGMTAQLRARKVLRLVAEGCQKLPKPVLAWTLSLQLSSLEAALAGHMPVTGHQFQALSDLTGLAMIFFQHGFLEEPSFAPGEYLSVFREIQRKQIPVEELRSFVERWEE